MLKYIISLLYIYFAFPTQISFEMLSEGEKVVLSLQKYFDRAEYFRVNDQKSSPGFRKVVKLTNNSDAIETISQIPLSVQINDSTINFNEHFYYSSKSIYNQPIKIFLLDNNIIMMYVYKEHCTIYDEDEKAKVVGLNITDNIPKNMKSASLNCTSMETQQIVDDVFLYVSCQKTEKNKSKTFYIVQIKLIPNTKGYIEGFHVEDTSQILSSISNCEQLGLKYLKNLEVNSTIYPPYIFAYCSQNTGSRFDKVFYFYNTTKSIHYFIYDDAVDCFTNTSYISQTENGFLTVKNNKLYQYYETYGEQAKCTLVMQNFQYIFATSRVYNKITFNYFFLENNTILIKSSYKTNFQQVNIDLTGYKLSSYAMTEKILGVCVTNTRNQSAIIVYSLEDLYPRKIDTLYENQVLELMSVANYLDSSYYFFVFHEQSNNFSLNSYNGFEIYIEMQKDIPHPLPDSFYDIAIQSLDDNENIQELTVHLTIREFSSQKIFIKPHLNKLQIDSEMMNVNLFSYAIGPVLKFHTMPNTNHDIHLAYVNYYDQINVKKYLTQTIVTEGILRNETLKFISIPQEIKIGKPLFYLYYSTFLLSCDLDFFHTTFNFSLACNEDQSPRTFHSQIEGKLTGNFGVSQDKWIQYNSTFIQICILIGNNGKCDELTITNTIKQVQITKVELIRYEERSTGSIKIELFIISNNCLYFGYFQKESTVKGDWFKYYLNFAITPEEIPNLENMTLQTIYYDKFYQNFLILHLVDFNEQPNKHKILVYDRPLDTSGTKFIGHLITQFANPSITNALNVENFIILIKHFSSTSEIVEYFISDKYSVLKTRTYPLYGHKIVKDGDHVSDGQFVYIEVQYGKTNAYLVYCPSASSTNILTHKIPKKGKKIKFIEELGFSRKKKYQSSIALNGQILHSLTIPNLILQFNSTKRISRCSMGEQNCNDGNFSVTLLDSYTVLHQITFFYVYDNSRERIGYTGPNEKMEINVTEEENDYHITGGYIHTLNASFVEGPVMSYKMKIEPQNCNLINNDPPFTDVFYQIGCLLPYDAKRYGTLLDFITIDRTMNFIIDVIVTTNNLICVENRIIKRIIGTTTKKSCSLMNQAMYNYFMVCDEGTETTITLIRDVFYCQNLTTVRIKKPSWLSYQYFKMKSSENSLIFEVPIRYEYNKVYFLSSYDREKGQISDFFTSLIYDERDNFITIDYDLDLGFAYLLVKDGLGIYDTWNTSESINPIVWISATQFKQILNIDGEFRYVKSLLQFWNEEKIYIELGTIKESYKICIELIESKKQIKNISIHSVYKQYKNCKNSVKSKSKVWEQLLLKICTLEPEEQYIFSNLYPITSVGSVTYVQFYQQRNDKNDGTFQSYYPFRMESINSNFNANDTFHINDYTSELITSSLFNFVCYYQLTPSLKWNLTKTSHHVENDLASDCTAIVTMNNTNFESEYRIELRENLQEINEQFWKPWVHRIFLFLMIVWFIIKYKKGRNIKKIRKNKNKLNIYSQEFEIKMKLNLEQETASRILLEKEEYQQQ